MGYQVIRQDSKQSTSISQFLNQVPVNVPEVTYHTTSAQMTKHRLLTRRLQEHSPRKRASLCQSVAQQCHTCRNAFQVPLCSFVIDGLMKVLVSRWRWQHPRSHVLCAPGRQASDTNFCFQGDLLQCSSRKREHVQLHAFS